METEEQIVWNIINTINENSTNQDNKVNERLVRSYLKVYRSALIREYSLNGQIVTDECFQFYRTVNFNYLRPRLFTADLPQIIKMSNNAGFYIQKNGETIPVVGGESFDLSIKNVITGKLPKAKILNNKLTLYIGNVETLTCGPHPENNFVITDFNNEIIDTNSLYVTADVYAILQNPADAFAYDWTVTPYPFPPELIAEMKKRILMMEFNIILQNEIDNVTDGIDKKN